jgi:excisionase family DNA binding protein
MKQEPVRPLAVTIAQAAQMTSLSQFTVREQIKKGRLRATKIGRRVVIPMRELERFVNGGPGVNAGD